MTYRKKTKKDIFERLTNTPETVGTDGMVFESGFQCGLLWVIGIEPKRWLEMSTDARRIACNLKSIWKGEKR